MLFTEEIHNWQDWGRLFQSVPAFTPLVRELYRREGLPFLPLQNLLPGTNAVFRVGETVVKVFAPAQSGLNTESDYAAELFGLRHAENKGVEAPRLLAFGQIQDKYLFYYLLMPYISGSTLGSKESMLSAAEKEKIGAGLKDITGRLNVPCPPFNQVRAVERALKNEGWGKFRPCFLQERKAFLLNLPPEPPVYVHGDLNEGNVLLKEDNSPFIIDFADGLLAPYYYEWVALFGMFDYSAAYMRGFLAALILFWKWRGSIWQGCLCTISGRGLLRQILAARKK